MALGCINRAKQTEHLKFHQIEIDFSDSLHFDWIYLHVFAIFIKHITNLFSKFQPKFLHLFMIMMKSTYEIQQLLNNCWCCCVSFISPKLYVIGHGRIEDWQENWRNYTLLHPPSPSPPTSPICILAGGIPFAFHVNIQVSVTGKLWHWLHHYFTLHHPLPFAYTCGGYSWQNSSTLAFHGYQVCRKLCP